MSQEELGQEDRMYTRRKALGATAVATLGMALGKATSSEADMTKGALAANQVHGWVKPTLEILVSRRGPGEYRELPPSQVRLAITDPSLTYDLKFSPNSDGQVHRRESINMDEPAPDATVQVSAATLRSVLEGSLNVELGLSQHRIIISGDRRVLAPLRMVPMYADLGLLDGQMGK